jgi:hypothetical protein
MSITYTYEIVSVDEQARCMEIVYSAEGHQTMHIGARLPFEGEDLLSVVKQFAPVPLWIELATPVVAPQVGAAGTIEPDPVVPAQADAKVLPTASSGEIPQAVL